MTMIYPNSPIIEALCEFQFEPGAEWDMTIPGIIYERIKDAFPIKKQRLGLGFQVTASEEGLKQNVNPLPPRIQFWRKDETALVQVAPNLLTINMLRPYTHWKEFKELITGSLSTFRDIAGPKGFKRIGLRYINRIDLAPSQVDMDRGLRDFFLVFPNVPDVLAPYANFFTRIEVPYLDGRDYLLVTLGLAGPLSEGKLPVMLDLDYSMVKASEVDLDEAGRWIEIGHRTIGTVFESCITDRTRALFKGV